MNTMQEINRVHKGSKLTSHRFLIESVQAFAHWVTKCCCSTVRWVLTRHIHILLYFILLHPPPPRIFLFRLANGQNTHFFSFKQNNSISFALWLKREKIIWQVIHCSIVLLHMTPGSWDILDVLEPWSWGENTRSNIGRDVCTRQDLILTWRSVNVCASNLDE